MKNVLFDSKHYIKPIKDDWENVLFELTDFCNLNCPFCLNDSSSDNKTYLSLSQFQVMLDKIKNKAPFVQLSGGEPLANPEFSSILEYLILNNVVFHINTNGTLMTDWLLETLLTYKRSSIQFSLDGATAITNDHIRCSGHYDKIVQIIKFLKQSDFRRGALKMVINKINYHEIEQNFMLAMEYGFLPTYSFVIRSGRAENNWPDLYLEDNERYEARNLIWHLIDKYSKYFDRFDNPGLISYLRNMNINYGGECQFNLNYCRFTPYIHVNGNVQPCQGLIDSEYCVGNLLVQTPDELFSHNNILVQSFLERVKQRRNILDKETCANCALNKTCGKGCILESLDSGDFNAKPATCYLRKKDFLSRMLK